MKSDRKIYTLRPYYIDSERLYDIYSTIMDGYSDAQEVVETTKDSIQKAKKLSGSGGFSVTSLLGNELKGEMTGRWNKVKVDEGEQQIKSTRQLSPTVLLNWLLNKMEEDSQIREVTSHWWHWPFFLRAMTWVCL